MDEDVLDDVDAEEECELDEPQPAITPATVATATTRRARERVIAMIMSCPRNRRAARTTPVLAHARLILALCV
ncbi:MAG: hypothetical protein JO181_04635 [Solirubrobacterales bacterium]|nr:hypothetical protein [Solirubrobacterales bacterium]MBV9800021.1 hypothetical protein [Solirubrobacterales bacterium]